MRPGIRLQVLFALGVLVVLSLVPLWLAVSRLTQAVVASALATGGARVPSGALFGLVALYTGIVGLSLLLFTYMAMTRLVVRPVEEIARAARRVAEGARELEMPSGGSQEIAELGGSLRSMTERLRDDERALRDKVDALERATKELRAAQEVVIRSERLGSVGRLAAGMAHEVGNPLAAVLGLLEILEDPDLPEEERRDFVKRAKRETERIHRVLRDLLDFARPQAVGEAVLAGGRAEVAPTVASVLALVRPQKDAKGVAFATDVPADLPAVAMDAGRLEQVLLNLVLNASDALGERGGNVTVRARPASTGRVCIEVEDDGPGVPESVRARLFEPFVSTKGPGRGTGLGLAVCRGLVEAAGGSIELGEAAAGARFVIDLPALARDQAS